MKRHVFFVIMLVVVLPALALAAPVKSVVHVYAPIASTFQTLATFPVSFEESDRPGWVRLTTSREIVRELRETGFEVDVLIDDLDAWAAARSASTRLSAQEPPPDAVPVLDHYFTHAEMTVFLEDLAATYPTLMTLDVIGQSVDGRDLFLVKISDNVATNENEPAMFYENNIHGDEIAGYTQALHIIQWLLTEYGTDPDVTAAVDDREIFFVPLSNPDGNYNDPTYGRSRYNSNGVDLNRNNGYMWDSAEWNSGSALHSEVETQALANVWVGDQPYVTGVSAHGGTVSISLPWSYHMDTPGDWDEFDFLGEGYCDACLDPDLDDWFQGSHGMYQIHGSTKDELYGSHGAAAWTIELTYTKQCSWTKAITTAQQHEPSFLWLFEQAGEGLHGAVAAADTKAPIAALILTAGKWNTFSDSDVGDFHKFLVPGTYNVTIQASGYQPYLAQVNVATGNPAILNAVLTPDPNPKAFAYRWIHSDCPNSEVSHLPTHNALGRADGDVFSIGFGGWVVLDLGPDGIENGVGPDLAIFEGHTDGDEDFQVYVKEAWEDSWTDLGSGVGTTDFDISTTGLTRVRYVKIEDGSLKNGAKASQYDGFDLDAIGTPAVFAAFSASSTSGEIPLTVQFSDSSTGSPDSWDWDFGDGETSTEQNPQHVYDEVGTYTVSLAVSGPAGSDTLVKNDYIHAYIGVPNADFSATPRQGGAPLVAQFTDASTGAIDSYSWDFGDDESSTEQNPEHAYVEPGRYHVNLTVTGPGGSDNERKWGYINVTCSTPDADFSADVTTGPAPLTVSFTNGTDTPEGCPATYVWAFGDGQNSAIQHPSHQYTTPGTYDVQLTATTTGGSDIETKTAYIVVTGGGDDDDDDNDDDTTDDDAADDDAADDDATDDDATDDDDDDTTDDDATDDDDDDASDDDEAEGDDDDDDDDSGCGC